jgi:UDP-N-acetylmuramate dehydrogenase
VSLPELETEVLLAPLTTLELGGAARHFARVETEAQLHASLAWAAERQLPVRVLGGGSNLVVRDEGVEGLVVAMGVRGLRWHDDGRVTAGAGEPWDAFVAAAVERGLAGLECLSGIPGQVGATPIQNVGAYGQEVAQTIDEVRVLDRRTGAVRRLGPEELAFGYRDSALKRAPERAVVLDVTFRLAPGGLPRIAYAELAAALGDRRPSLREVREAVLALRRKKSMVLDPADPNRRSAGSFFTNPIVDAERADEVVRRALAEGVVAEASQVPRWPEGPRVKLAAGWLIERAGITRGLRRGAVGVSTAHALALVHHGGGRTADLLALAEEVRGAVLAHFGVSLEREPVLW